MLDFVSLVSSEPPPFRTDTVRSGGSGFTRLSPPQAPTRPLLAGLWSAADSSGSELLLQASANWSLGLAGASRGLNKDSSTRDSIGEEVGDIGLDTEFRDSWLPMVKSPLLPPSDGSKLNRDAAPILAVASLIKSGLHFLLLWSAVAEPLPPLAPGDLTFITVIKPVLEPFLFS